MGLNWADAESRAVARGAHLASITSAAENSYLVAFARATAAPYGTFWIGGYRTDSNCSPACFTWTTGEPWSFENWGPSGEPFDSWGCWNPNPNNCGWSGPGTGLAVEFITWGAYSGLWNDETPNLIGIGGAAGAPSIIEWSADCNNDGLVDYGQILAGELADANLNNIPDCCEGGASCNPCPGDVDNSGAVNGVDLAAILNSWGTSGGKYPGADVNHDSVVNGSDLAIVLNGWGPCP